MLRSPAKAAWSAPVTSAAQPPGVYTWLPLGLKVLRKVENIIREEMDAIGAQEVHFPHCCPANPTRQPTVGMSTAITLPPQGP